MWDMFKFDIFRWVLSTVDKHVTDKTALILEINQKKRRRAAREVDAPPNCKLVTHGLIFLKGFVKYFRVYNFFSKIQKS